MNKFIIGMIAVMIWFLSATGASAAISLLGAYKNPQGITTVYSKTSPAPASEEIVGTARMLTSGPFDVFEISLSQFDFETFAKVSIKVLAGQRITVGSFIGRSDTVAIFPLELEQAAWVDSYGTQAFTGQFSINILEVTYNTAGTAVTSIAFDATQRRSTDQGPIGQADVSVRFNSSIPLGPVPEPTTTTTLLMVAALGLRRKR